MSKLGQGMVIGACVIALATLAWAGKPEREKQKEITAKATTVKGDVKKACGCAVGVDVKWATFKTVENMSNIERTVRDFGVAAAKHCSDADSKKALCKSLKSVEIFYNKDGASLKLAGKVIKAGCNSSYPGDSMFKDILDKF